MQFGVGAVGRRVVAAAFGPDVRGAGADVEDAGPDVATGFADVGDTAPADAGDSALDAAADGAAGGGVGWALLGLPDEVQAASSAVAASTTAGSVEVRPGLTVISAKGVRVAGGHQDRSPS
ncbi:hypothetical protein [Yinghuangia seranimata]|uniref:hypothetical protein n=1 Tax=Yinghuangia seranimata TaxID=408067 RepID=UPI00248C953A|nr:hypothetical protein [Yinghuangia seranimata]MDI2129585.1 hypothetical protein [Yinghuangia seranimata]